MMVTLLDKMSVERKNGLFMAADELKQRTTKSAWFETETETEIEIEIEP
jgi:hypothetical protein